jgi:uncharacterized protein (TIGR00730 family)
MNKSQMNQPNSKSNSTSNTNEALGAPEPAVHPPGPLTKGGLKNVCVYCGSGNGLTANYANAARVLGQSLAKAGVGLVYGGGSLGLMGEVASATIKNGGHVTGIIPSFLSNRERMLKDVHELVVTDDMHQRKMEMFKRSDAFIALPGGIGTLEELVEQLTWAQLGRHHKPIILANIDGFWSPFMALLDHMTRQNFIRPGLEVTFKVVNSAEEILPVAMQAAQVAQPDKDEEIAERF